MKPIEQIRILVVGDIMLDKYVVGEVNRISPEAPVPVVKVIDEYYTLGGCANVVRNLRELGVQVDCLASIGVDRNGELIKEELKLIGAGPLLFYGSTQSTIKERIIADQRKVQMIRIDREETKKIQPNLPINILAKMNSDQKKYDMIIVSDYAKGMITHELMEFLKYKVNSDIIVDPKPINSSIYNGVYMITPNEKEWGMMMSSFEYTLNNVKYILETRGSKGMCLLDNKFEIIKNITSIPIAVSNVSGCGDVVVSIITVCITMGFNIITSAKIANKCAGYTAALPGTSIITKEKFDQYMNEVLGKIK